MRLRHEQEVAERLGFGEFEAYYRDRRARGWTINEIAQEAGHDRQWLRVARDRYESTSVHHHRLHAERRHTLTAIGLGFPDLDSYLRQRHVQEGRGTTELAHELGVDAHQVHGLLERRGILRPADDLKRKRAAEERAAVAVQLGFDSFAAYLDDRRARGWTIVDIAREAGRSPGWVLHDPSTGRLRRRSDLPPSPPDSRSRPLPQLPGSLGQLSEGVAYYAPPGLLPHDEAAGKVQCHLCGGWFHSVGRHAWLAHGWRHDEYVEAFGLRWVRPLCTPDVSEKHRTAMAMQYAQSAKTRSDLAMGQDMLKDRELRQRWREEKIRPGLLERVRQRPELINVLLAADSEEKLQHRLARLRELGFDDLVSYLRDRRLTRRWTVAQIASEGLGPASWISKRLVDLGLSQPAARGATELALISHLRDLGFSDWTTYLRTRYVAEMRSIAEIARELSTYPAVVLRRLRWNRIPRRDRRLAGIEARLRKRDREEARIAATFGFGDFPTYLKDRVQRPFTLADIAAEVGHSPAWVKFGLERHSSVRSRSGRRD